MSRDAQSNIPLFDVLEGLAAVKQLVVVRRLQKPEVTPTEFTLRALSEHSTEDVRQSVGHGLRVVTPA